MLPSDLGFLSTNNIVGQMLYGNEIMMYHPDNSQNLKQFYKNVFTGLKFEETTMMKFDTIAAVSGRIKLVLPFRTDKALQNLKNDFMISMNTTYEAVMDRNEKFALFCDHGMTSSNDTDNFIYNYLSGRRGGTRSGTPWPSTPWSGPCR
jgi:hypothetical protein